MWESVVVVFIVVMVIAIFAVATTREEEGEIMRKKDAGTSRKEERGRSNRTAMEMICALECTVQALLVDINKLIKQGDCIMKTLDDVLEKVREANTVDKSLIALTRGIKAKLDQIIAGGLSPAQQAKVDSLFTEVETGQAEVAAAVVENTPAEEAPPA